MKDPITNYSDAEKKLFEYFDYREDWHVYPVEIATDMFWSINGSEVMFGDSRNEVDTYSNEILRDRFTNKSRYDAKDGKYVAFLVDTQCDGNKFFQIFSADKEVKE